MTATNRPIISVLLSLLLVMSGPALAVSSIAGGQSDTAMADCGSMMMDQSTSASSRSDVARDCVSSPDMTCPSALNLCSGSVALFLAVSDGLIDAGSQPVLNARTDHYQDPFLALVTPPPEHHS